MIWQDIISEFYHPGSRAHDIILTHGRMVADKALSVAWGLQDEHPDFEFIRDAAMLHDVGIFMTQSPRLGCYGDSPYICHGVLGRALLEYLDLPKHALVCERHIGVGLTVKDIQLQKLPLPVRDMAPVSLEEVIVCYADKFFSKTGNPKKMKSIAEILDSLKHFGYEKALLFQQWADRFERVNPPRACL